MAAQRAVVAAALGLAALVAVAGLAAAGDPPVSPAPPAPSAAAVAPPAPAAAAPAPPVEVFWAEPAAKRTVVELGGLSDAPVGEDEESEASRAAAILADCLDEDAGDGDRDLPDTKECRLPRFPIGRPVAVTTPKGTKPLRVTGYAARRGYEREELLLVLEGTPDGGPALAIVGRDVPADLALRKAAGPAAKSVKPALAKLTGQLVVRPKETEAATAIGTDLAAALPTLAKRAKASVVVGRFAGGATWLVTLTRTLETNEMGPDTLFEAMVFATEDGRITGYAVHPSADYGTDAPAWLVDADGDGFDEVLVHSRCYEGAHELYLDWDGAKATVRTLTGEDAGGCAGLMGEAAE